MVGAYRAGQKSLIFWALAMPFYWALLFWPTLRAIAELQTRPFHWHKTKHGVSASRKFELNEDDMVTSAKVLHPNMTAE